MTRMFDSRLDAGRRLAKALAAPAGRCQLEATYGDAKRSVSASVAKEAKQPGMVVFRFPGVD